MLNDKGQSLLELVVVIAVALLVVGAITFATISSLRNASFAKNQAQATKLAQEGIEKVRAGRDRNGSITDLISNQTINWNSDELWANRIETSCAAHCYFNVSSSGDITSIGSGSNIPSAAELKDQGRFKRVLILSDDVSYQSEKKVTVIVSWTDFAGEHQSKLVTILRRI